VTLWVDRHKIMYQNRAKYVNHATHAQFAPLPQWQDEYVAVTATVTTGRAVDVTEWGIFLIPSASPHARAMRALGTCSDAIGIGLTAIGVALNGVGVC